MVLGNLTRRFGAFVAGVALLTAAAIVVADARPRSGGSRGDRTFSTPAPTPTAPRAAEPLQRTQGPAATPGGPAAAPSAAQPGVARPAPGPAAAPTAAAPSFGRSLMTGLLVGGLFGLVMGGGLMGGFAGMLALFIQLAVIGLIIFVVMRLLRGRAQQTPAYAGRTPPGGPQPSPYTAAQPMPGAAARQGHGPMGLHAGGSTPLTLAGPDFEAFEQLLGGVMAAYSAGDMATLQRLVTPELAGYYADDLKADAENGTINRIAGVKLLQGDLSEAWREASGEYATVAMRYEIADALIERKTGKVLQGSEDENDLHEVTEVWTFLRPHGSTPGTGWVVSAIQDVSAEAQA